jgi:hypothetical protein
VLGKIRAKKMIFILGRILDRRAVWWYLSMHNSKFNYGNAGGA